MSQGIHKSLLAFFLAVVLAGASAVSALAQNETNSTAPAEVSGDPLPAPLVADDDLADKALQDLDVEGLDGQEQEEGAEDDGDYAFSMDLGQAVRHALENNNTIFAAKANALGAEASRKSALGDFFPSLSLQYGYTKYDHKRPMQGFTEDMWNMGVNVHQDIFTGGRLENTFLKAKVSRDKAEDDLFSTELELILSVQENFLALLQAREDVRSAQDSVRRLQSQLRVTQAFYDVGLKPKLDVLQAEVDLAQAENELLKARNSVATQEARLNTLLTEPLQARIKYVGELEFLPFTMELEDCLERAFANRPDLKAMEKSVIMAEKDSKIAFSGLLPQVGADFDLSRTGSGMDVQGNKYSGANWSQWSVSVNASWKVFDWGSTWYSWRGAQQGVRQYEATLENLRQEVAYGIKAQFLKIEEAKERIKVMRTAVASAKESYRMAVARYQAQVGTNTDVLDAQSRLTEAEANLTQAMADHQKACASMYVAMGLKNYSLMPY